MSGDVLLDEIKIVYNFIYSDRYSDNAWQFLWRAGTFQWVFECCLPQDFANSHALADIFEGKNSKSIENYLAGIFFLMGEIKE